MSWPDPRPLRLLVIRYRFIGDTVLAIPFLHNLRLAFPNATIDVLAEPISGDTLATCPYKNELMFYGPRLKGERKRQATFPTGLWSMARELRRFAGPAVAPGAVLVRREGDAPELAEHDRVRRVPLHVQAQQPPARGLLQHGFDVAEEASKSLLERQR